ncbi:MAG: iron-containing alcohol dehydrogenase [Deltaproteobacteria bacterium]|jgi:alcohol dehydrogenase class IV
MLPFSYHLTPSIKFGCSLASELGEELISVCAEKRVVIISDPGVTAAGLADAVLASLEKAGFAADLFNDLRGESSAGQIDAAAEMIRALRPAAVIGLGGGSALDVAKLATVLSVGDHRAEYYALMNQPLPQRTSKLIMLPTTAGTGAEVTRTAVFNNADNRKVWAWGDELAADLVILDPELTLTLPKLLTAATALDAMVHAIEACSAKNSNPLVQAFGLHAIRLISQNLEKTFEQPQDLDTRGRLLMASTLAGMAIDAAGTGIAHAIGHALGTIAGIHHGRAAALALKVVFLKNAEAAAGIHSEIALALGVQAGSAPIEKHARMGAQAFGDFVRRTGIEMSLKPDGLTRKDLDRLVDAIHSKENTPMLENNCYCASEADIREFARQILS